MKRGSRVRRRAARIVVRDRAAGRFEPLDGQQRQAEVAQLHQEAVERSLVSHNPAQPRMTVRLVGDRRTADHLMDRAIEIYENRLARRHSASARFLRPLQ